ncbi:hypothetical protein Bbelb_172740 [Branchiostoma belcheri]|nr:hypothetical protein Bbelb_172740 [Branchiostoma belcheri]
MSPREIHKDMIKSLGDDSPYYLTTKNWVASSKRVKESTKDKHIIPAFEGNNHREKGRNAPSLPAVNTPVHTTQGSLAAANEYGFEVLPHSSYSPDLAPWDFYLFPKLELYLRGQRFDGDDGVIDALDEDGQSRPNESPGYWRDGIGIKLGCTRPLSTFEDKAVVCEAAVVFIHRLPAVETSTEIRLLNARDSVALSASTARELMLKPKPQELSMTSGLALTQQDHHTALRLSSNEAHLVQSPKSGFPRDRTAGRKAMTNTPRVSWMF